VVELSRHAEAAAVELPLRAEAAVVELPRHAEAAGMELPLHAEAVVAAPLRMRPSRPTQRTPFPKIKLVWLRIEMRLLP